MKTNSVYFLYFINNKINQYIEESNENKYFTLVPTDECKYIFKMYEGLWSKIRDPITPITNGSDNYDKKSNLIRMMICL